jgi:thioesterase domain-containing protein
MGPDPMYDLDAFLATHIPITQAMGIRLEAYDADQLTLHAPLQPNRNDKGTGFAGVLATLVTLSGWSYTHVSLADAGFHAIALVAKSDTEYRRPAISDLHAVCYGPDRETRRRFMRDLDERGKARWTLEVELWSDETMAVHYTGDYVAIKQERKDWLSDIA